MEQPSTLSSTIPHSRFDGEMASLASRAFEDTAHLAFRLNKWDESQAELQAIYCDEEFDIGRLEVYRLLGVYDKTISTHHLRIRCVVYDEAETDVPPMVYIRVLSSKGILLSQDSPQGRISRHLTKFGGEALLNQGDTLQISSTISAEFCARKATDSSSENVAIESTVTLQSTTDKFLVTPRVIGSGAYAKVVIAKKCPEGSQFACKVVALTSKQEKQNSHPRLDDPTQNIRKKRDALMREIDLLRKLDHPNVVRVEKVFISSTNLYVFQELATAGDLMSYLRMRGGLQEPEVISIAYQLAKAVEYLHANNVVHRDIKPENILMSSWRQGARVILTDFGQSRLMESQASATRQAAAFRMESLVGTDGWVAPELYKRRRMAPDQGPRYSEAIDIWAIGTVTTSLFITEMPFETMGNGTQPSPDPSNSQQIERMFRLDFLDQDHRWTGVSGRAKAFIRECLALDETKRLTAKTAVAHPWFTCQNYSADLMSVYARAISGHQHRQDDCTLIQYAIAAVKDCALPDEGETQDVVGVEASKHCQATATAALASLMNSRPSPSDRGPSLANDVDDGQYLTNYGSLTAESNRLQCTFSNVSIVDFAPPESATLGDFNASQQSSPPSMPPSMSWGDSLV